MRDIIMRPQELRKALGGRLGEIDSCGNDVSRWEVDCGVGGRGVGIGKIKVGTKRASDWVRGFQSGRPIEN